MRRDQSLALHSAATASTSEQFTIAIVGGGFSGTVLAIQLLRMGLPKTDLVVLIEQNPRIGPGLAYSVEDECCLLNVPAGNMSALADDPGHFLHYCQRIDPKITSSSFVPRRLYGQYIEQLLCETAALYPEQLQQLRASVVDLELISPNQCRLDFANHASILANKVVLALGHFAPRPLAALKSLPTEVVIAPWDTDQLQKTPAALPIAILGTGHTAIDALLRLQANVVTQKVYLLSRRGLLPQSHRVIFTAADPYLPHCLENSLPTARAFTKALRGEIKKYGQDGGDWRDIFNQIRAHTPDLWQRLSIKERARFLRQLVPYWDMHRHRLAPNIGKQIDEMQKQGTIEIIAGRIESAQMQHKLIHIQYRDRGSQELKLIEVGAIIQCNGPNYDLSTVPDPLIQSLIRRNYLQQDALNIGIETGSEYRLQSPSHPIQQHLYYIGPLLKARYWESIAVPELRVHVQRLAAQLLYRK